MAKKLLVKIVQFDEAEKYTQEYVKTLWADFGIIITAFIHSSLVKGYEWFVHLKPTLKPNDYKHIFDPLLRADTDNKSIFHIECSSEELKKRLIECELKITEDIPSNNFPQQNLPDIETEDSNGIPLGLKIDMCISFATGKGSIADILSRYRERLEACGHELGDIDSMEENAKGEIIVFWAGKINDWMSSLLKSGHLVEVLDEVNGPEIFCKGQEPKNYSSINA